MKIKKLLLGFIVGGITAGIASLLTAPASGRETRSYIKEQKDEFSKEIQKLKEELAEVNEAFVHLSKEGKEAVLTFIEDVKALIEIWKEEVKPNQIQIQNDLNSIQEAVKELEKSLETSKIK